MVWWRHDVVYQIYPRSFRDSSGDGVGDLPGILEKLDYLAEVLGVGAVWISPFFRSPMADFGYDVSDYCDVDPLFGTLADFDRLVQEAHARGLKVIVDYVPNHTSDQHPWFVESRASREALRRDFYVWRDPKPDGSPPNNWLSIFGGPAWELDDATGQYYLHTFLKQQPDLNWRSPAARAAMLDVLRFWLARGVDGFRIDAFHFVMKDPELRDNPPNVATHAAFHRGLGAYDLQLHVHDVAHPDLHDVLRDVRRVLDDAGAEGSERVAIGEAHIYDPQRLCAYYGAALDELHLPFNFGLLNAAWQARAVRAVVDAYEAALPPGSWPNYVLGNHDEPRIASRVGEDQARIAMMLLLTLRGTPTLYYGDELGMQDVPVPPDQAQDPWGKNVEGLGLGRDPERTPMRWDAGPSAGFCPPAAVPWLPVGGDVDRINVAAQRDDPRSMLTLTRRLLALRRAREALFAGAYASVDHEGIPETCYVFTREAGGDRVLVALNFSNDACEVRLPGVRLGELLVSTHLDREGELGEGGLALRPAEGCVVTLR
ncbi:alpha-amylase family glycosyl hydrolase [Sorangium sp. So ce136]|uniref:alpha-amylase family glycosyl hydrolase n=1 Tax=Sorangium sp. So ce136 TaxID=3133284 RepID=UPI003F11E882